MNVCEQHETLRSTTKNLFYLIHLRILFPREPSRQFSLVRISDRHRGYSSHDLFYLFLFMPTRMQKETFNVQIAETLAKTRLFKLHRAQFFCYVLRVNSTGVIFYIINRSV